MPTQRRNRQRKNRRNSQRGGFLESLTNLFTSNSDDKKTNEATLPDKVPPPPTTTTTTPPTTTQTTPPTTQTMNQLGGKPKKNKSNKKRGGGLFSFRPTARIAPITDMDIKLQNEKEAKKQREKESVANSKYDEARLRSFQRVYKYATEVPLGKGKKTKRKR